MRDYETIETALTAAETGHLVFSTLHTLDATETINRIISVFPPHQQKQIRLQLGAVLKAVVSLRLVPRADGHGRVPAVEVLIAHHLHPRVHREQGEDEAHPRRDRSRARRQYGMQTFDQSLYQPLQVGADHARRGAAARDQPGRVQAQDPGHPVHLRHRARGDGRRARGALGLQPAPGGVALRLLQPASGTRLDEARRPARPAEPASAEAAFERALRLLAIRPRGRARAADGARASAASRREAVAGAHRPARAAGAPRRRRRGPIGASRQRGSLRRRAGRAESCGRGASRRRPSRRRFAAEGGGRARSRGARAARSTKLWKARTRARRRPLRAPSRVRRARRGAVSGGQDF